MGTSTASVDRGMISLGISPMGHSAASIEADPDVFALSMMGCECVCVCVGMYVCMCVWRVAEDARKARADDKCGKRKAVSGEVENRRDQREVGNCKKSPGKKEQDPRAKEKVQAPWCAVRGRTYESTLDRYFNL